MSKLSVKVFWIGWDRCLRPGVPRKNQIPQVVLTVEGTTKLGDFKDVATEAARKVSHNFVDYDYGQIRWILGEQQAWVDVITKTKRLPHEQDVHTLSELKISSTTQMSMVYSDLGAPPSPPSAFAKRQAVLKNIGACFATLCERWTQQEKLPEAKAQLCLEALSAKLQRLADGKDDKEEKNSHADKLPPFFEAIVGVAQLGLKSAPASAPSSSASSSSSSETASS